MSKLSDMARTRAQFSPKQAPQTKPEASPEQKEASGISQGTRSDKKPLVRVAPKGKGGPIWRDNDD